MSWRLSLRQNNQLKHKMATIAQTGIIPRFLLPQLTWGKVSFKYAAPAGLVALQSYHTSSNVQQRRAFAQPTRRSLDATNQQWQPKRSALAIQNTSFLGLRRNFSATAYRARDHHFDTLKFVQRLKDEGFTEEQSEAMMRVLSDVIEERLVAPHKRGLSLTDIHPASRT